MQDETAYLARISTQVGLKINKKKTKILRLNTTCERQIMLKEAGLEEIESQRKGSISHFEKRVKVQDNRLNNENPSVQHTWQVGVAIRSRIMANEQDHTEKDREFCKSVLAKNIGNTVDGQS